MVGRAGRYGFDLQADSYLCVPESQINTQRKQAFDLLNKDKMEYITSCISSEKKGLGRLILDSIGTMII